MEDRHLEQVETSPAEGEGKKDDSKVERRFFALASASVLAFKMKLEREFPVPVKFLGLQALVKPAPSNIEYVGFTSMVAVAEEKREGQLESVAKVYTFHFPPILPHYIQQIESFYILLTFVVLSFRRLGIVPHIYYIPHTDTLSLVVYDKEHDKEDEKARQVVWEVILPFRELMLEPTGVHSFVTYKRGKIRLVEARFWELSAFARDD